MFRHRFPLILIIWILPVLSFSQGEFNNWIWGGESHVSWNTGVPVLQPPTGIFFGAENASVSDSAGNLLFYCDGQIAYNKNFMFMPHGTGLNGGAGSWSQTVLSVPDQTHPKRHFVFTSGMFYSTWAEYSVVDMSLDGGLGDVDINERFQKLKRSGNCVNGISGTRAKNNRDTWIVFKKTQPDSSVYLSYKVTSAGIINEPVISPSEYVVLTSTMTEWKTWQIKISHDGTKLVANYKADTLEICNFNSETGSVTSKFLVHLYDLKAHIEFSPDSRFLYFIRGTKVCQADMSIEDSAQFVQHIVEVSSPYNSLSSIQVAVDGKIYIGREDDSWLAVINNPNATGPACNFVYDAFGINDPCLSQGFPDFIQRYKAYVHPDTSCMTVNFTSDTWPPADSIIWNFGDGSNISTAPNPVHTYPLPGNYQVMLYVRHNDNRHDTTWKTVVIQPSPQPWLGPDKTICAGNSAVLDAGSCAGCTFQWTNLTTGLPAGTNQTCTVSQTGVYEVEVTNPGGCSGTDTIQVVVSPPPAVTTTPLTKTICTGETTNIALTSTIPTATFNWTAALTSGLITGFSPDSGTVINQTLINTGTTSGVVTYTITPKLGSCLGTPVDYAVTVNTGDLVDVSIAASDNDICSGTFVTFTATPTGTGTLTYDWKVNGISQSVNNPVFTFIPANGDVVTCLLTSSITTCVTNNPATSNAISMVVNPLLPLAVSVSPSANPVCAVTNVTYVTNVTNAGTSPVYQWQVNGIISGGNTPTYAYTPVNGDIVTCTLTSSESCLVANPVTSPPVTMTVNPNVTASVSITASQNPVCAFTNVMYVTNVTNGGANPVYQWKVNGVNQGGNLPNYTYFPDNGDIVACNMITSLSCALPLTASSNPVSMSVIASPVVTYTHCTDSITTTNARPVRLKGGIPLGGTYSGPGVNSVTGVFTPAIAGPGTKTITYSYTNAASCSGSKTKNILVLNPPASICGIPFTDVRDGQVYKTVQIGTQCWMAEDLNFGIEIPETTHQRDNCISENYRHVGTSSRRNALYQWDELMQYSSTSGEQGLCPPGWHVPTEPEWQILFSNYGGNAFAGAALKFSGFSGFLAGLDGISYQNHGWSFADWATCFWSSTSNGPYKAWAHAMNATDPSVAGYSSARQNAFAVRCIRD